MNWDFLGFVHKYPLPKEKITKKKERHLKKIDDIAKMPDAVLVFQDEVHYTLQSNITAMWAPRGSKPKVKSYPVKDKVSYSGFIIPESGELVVTKPSWFNYETVIQSLREFLEAKPCPEGKKYCVVLDNAPWHKKAIRLIWTEQLEEYADIREKVEYLSLPPYSPDLNPIEQVWRKTRREKTHNRFFNVLSKLVNVLDDYFAQFFMPNKQLRSLCSFSCFA